jgi:acyl-CoA synthetase (AMP-forming)/AMP-acid ligase II
VKATNTGAGDRFGAALALSADGTTLAVGALGEDSTATGFDGDQALVRVLQEHVKATIAPYKYPRQVQFVSALPKTDTGKLQRFRLKETS